MQSEEDLPEPSDEELKELQRMIEGVTIRLVIGTDTAWKTISTPAGIRLLEATIMSMVQETAFDDYCAEEDGHPKLPWAGPFEMLGVVDLASVVAFSDDKTPEEL
jgi:hypothetical protein